MLDSLILDTIDALKGKPQTADVWRVTWASRDPMVGGVGGGRWSPPDEFEVLYASFEKNGALAEAYFHLSRAPVFSSSTMRINQLAVVLANVLELDVKTIMQLGVEDPLSSRIDYSFTQQIGKACHLLDYQGMIVPSARYECSNLVLFLDRIDIDSQIKVVSSKDINWPAWKESLRAD